MLLFILCDILIQGVGFMQFICLFLPPLLALWVDMNINKINSYSYNLIIKYFLYCLFINYFNNLVVWFISSEKYYYYSMNTFTYDFCFKFLSMSIIFSVVIPVCFKIIKDNFKLEIEVRNKKNDKEDN